MKKRFLSGILVLAFAVSSCSVEVDQSILITASPNLEPAATAIASQSNTVTTSHVPITWAHLNLSGRLVYVNGTAVDGETRLQIQVLNLVSGEVTTIFEAPKDASIYHMSVSPDYTWVLMSYSPPPGEDSEGQDLYIMPLDGSQPPELLFTPPSKGDDYSEVEWAPDGKYIYFTQINQEIPLEPGQVYPLYEIYRMAFPDGQPEKIAEKAYWPRPSADSRRIVYVSVDPFSIMNKLFVADGNGENAYEVVLRSPLPPDIKGAPIFAPDGQSILFSAPVPVQSRGPSWIDKLMGVHVVKAHGDVASDWWSVPVHGGPITQLTNVQSSDLFASFAPDNKYIVSFSSDGLFVMNPDGSKLTMLLPNPQAVHGTVRWIP